MARKSWRTLPRRIAGEESKYRRNLCVPWAPWGRKRERKRRTNVSSKLHRGRARKTLTVGIPRQWSENIQQEKVIFRRMPVLPSISLAVTPTSLVNFPEWLNNGDGQKFSRIRENKAETCKPTFPSTRASKSQGNCPLRVPGRRRSLWVFGSFKFKDIQSYHSAPTGSHAACWEFFQALNLYLMHEMQIFDPTWYLFIISYSIYKKHFRFVKVLFWLLIIVTCSTLLLTCHFDISNYYSNLY